MRGLTVEEYARLRAVADTGHITFPCNGNRRTDFSGARDDLVEQGRTVRIACPCHGLLYSALTPAGREALRLWPLLRERMEGER